MGLKIAYLWLNPAHNVFVGSSQFLILLPQILLNHQATCLEIFISTTMPTKKEKEEKEIAIANIFNQFPSLESILMNLLLSAAHSK